MPFKLIRFNNKEMKEASSLIFTDAVYKGVCRGFDVIFTVLRLSHTAVWRYPHKACELTNEYFKFQSCVN